MKKRNVAVSGNEENSHVTKELCHFRCINCGRGARDLFKDYNNGIIKMIHCVNILFWFYLFWPCIFECVLNINDRQDWKHVLTINLVPLLKIYWFNYARALCPCNFVRHAAINSSYSIFKHACAYVPIGLNVSIIALEQIAWLDQQRSSPSIKLNQISTKLREILLK